RTTDDPAFEHSALVIKRSDELPSCWSEASHLPFGHVKGAGVFATVDGEDVHQRLKARWIGSFGEHHLAVYGKGGRQPAWSRQRQLLEKGQPHSPTRIRLLLQCSGCAVWIVDGASTVLAD